MAAAFGIHFGNTSACLASCKDGKADVVANDAGDRVTPAIVSFTQHEMNVGLPAKQGLIRNASNTVCNIKQLLGVKFQDEVVQNAVGKSRAKMINKNDLPAFEVDYKEKTAVFESKEIATFIYKKMKDIACSVKNSSMHDAVLTVPLEFTEEQKKILKESATKAGFNVLRMIHEPSAAVLAYDLGQKDIHEQSNILVYRFGGISLDVTIVNVSNGLYRIVSAVSDKQDGGHKVTDSLVQYFASEFKKQWKCDCLENKRAVIKLKNASENCKHILSTMPSSQCSVESLYEGIDLQCNISRARFESLCSGILQECLLPIDEALKKANMAKNDIQKVILCGGSTKIPVLQKYVGDFFPQAEILSSLNPDEVMAIGAAKQASILQGSEEAELQRNEMETEVPSLSQDILIKIKDDEDTELENVIPKGTPVPVRRTRKFQLAADQTNLCMCIVTKTSPDNKPVPLAQIVLEELTAGSEVTGVFHIKSDGSLHISCSEPTSGKSDDVYIEGS